MRSQVTAAAQAATPAPTADDITVGEKQTRRLLQQLDDVSREMALLGQEVKAKEQQIQLMNKSVLHLHFTVIIAKSAWRRLQSVYLRVGVLLCSCRRLVTSATCVLTQRLAAEGRAVR